MTGLRSKVAVITGGSYGIGAAIAQKFGQLGYAVAIVGRSEEKLRTTADQLSAQGIACRWWQCDVTQWSEVLKTVESINTELGAPTLLVNNAGGWIGTKIADIDPLEMNRLIEVCVSGTMYFTKAILPIMREHRSGFILNIGSTSGLPGSQDSVLASTPKGAVRLFTHTLARELAGSGIRVAILHPARVDKKKLESEIQAQDDQGLYTKLSAKQVAEAAAFMAEQPANVTIRELVITPSDIFI